MKTEDVTQQMEIHTEVTENTSKPPSNKQEVPEPEPTPLTPRKSTRARKQTAKAMEFVAKLKTTTNEGEQAEVQSKEENTKSELDSIPSSVKSEKIKETKGENKGEKDKKVDANIIDTFTKMVKSSSPRIRGRAKSANKESEAHEDENSENETTDTEEDVTVEIIAKIPQRKVEEIVNEATKEDDEEMETQSCEDVDENAEDKVEDETKGEENDRKDEEVIPPAIQIEPRKEDTTPEAVEQSNSEESQVERVVEFDIGIEDNMQSTLCLQCGLVSTLSQMI